MNHNNTELVQPTKLTPAKFCNKHNIAKPELEITLKKNIKAVKHTARKFQSDCIYLSA